MNELIKVTINETNDQIVRGRELHEFLEVNSNYTTWFTRMVEYGFNENEDFVPILEESTGGRKSIDHAIKLDMAKEISMIQRNEKGKQARKYFIEVEKQYKKGQIPIKQSSSEEAKLLNAQARLENAKTRKAAMYLKLSDVDTLSKEYKNILVAQAVEVMSGEKLLPHAKSEQKTYSATELGEMFGITPQKLGAITNKHNLKTDGYGEWYRDKSPYSSKEVDSFRYYDAVIPRLEKILI